MFIDSILAALSVKCVGPAAQVGACAISPALSSHNYRAHFIVLIGTVECNDGLSTSRYGIQRTLNDDDGFESVPLNEVIFDTASNRFNTFIGELAQALLQELLNKLSAGNIDPDYVAKKIEANPIVSRCEIRLVIQRVRKGEFDAGFDGGDISASSSADVMIVYNPSSPF